jgi:hypothetical protein
LRLRRHGRQRTGICDGRAIFALQSVTNALLKSFIEDINCPSIINIQPGQKQHKNLLPIAQPYGPAIANTTVGCPCLYVRDNPLFKKLPPLSL